MPTDAEKAQAKAIMSQEATRHQQLAYPTASEIVSLAEMLGSSRIVGSVERSKSTGSARLVDMTAHHHQSWYF